MRVAEASAGDRRRGHCPLPVQVKQLRALIWARLVVVTAIVAPWFLLLAVGPPAGDGFFTTLIAQAYREAEPLGVQSLVIVTMLASLFYGVLLQRSRVPTLFQAAIQLGGDLLLVSWLVYTFGGIQSPFSMFYPVVIVMAAYIFGRPVVATTFATVAFFQYSILLTGIYLGWSWPPVTARIEAETTLRLAYNFVVALIGFYSVALLGATLSRRTRLVEEELREKKEDLASLRVVHQDIIQSIVSGLLTTDPKGMVSSVNRAGQKILGVDEERLLGRLASEGPIFDSTLWQSCLEECIRTGRARDEVVVDREGEGVSVGFSMTRLKDAQDEPTGYIVIFQDLTEKRKLEEELRVRDRMAAVGELAAGIAHEIGNPLAAISGSAQMLSGSLPADASGARLVDIILKESRRLDRTIKGFLRFARPKDSALVRFDVVELLREHFALLSNSEEVAASHELSLDLGHEPVMMIGDADQIHQILWNLSRNSLRAMPDGGTLLLRGHQSAPGTYLLQVIDSGRGMTPEERAKLFQPFQSFFDRGTGIGMSIVYRIVQEHGGRLRVESSEGKGTTITVELPLVPQLRDLKSSGVGAGDAGLQGFSEEAEA